MDTTRTSPPAARSQGGPLRILWQAALVFTGLWVGFAIGGLLAANFFVARSEGLAGAVEVIFWGLAGAILLAIAVGIAAPRLPPGVVALAGKIALAISLTLLAAALIRSRMAPEDPSPTPPLRPTAPTAPL